MADAGIPWALSSYRSASLPISAQQIVNFSTEVQREGMDAKTPAALIGSPGLVEFATVGAGPIRAILEMNGVLYSVSGTQLYSIDSAGTETLLGGGIAPGSNVISIAGSGTQVLVTDGTSGFAHTVSPSAYAQISDVDFPNAQNTVIYLNGYFLFDWKNTNKFFSSDADQGLNYDALFFSSAETSDDFVQAVLKHQQQLLVGGKKSFEVWQFNPNTSGFPWVRFPGVNIDIGIAGPLAGTRHKSKIFFVGSDKLFYRMEGGQPQMILDPGVASVWRDYSTVSDAVVWGMTWGVQEWIFITFPTVNKTWVYDDYTTFFHERVSHDSDMVSLGRWRGNVYANCYNKHLIGDAYTNQIGYLDAGTYTEYGNNIQSRAVAPAMHAKGATVHMSSLELLMETGVGLTTGQGSDPQIVLDWSNDNGKTFEPFEMSRSFGKIGEFQKIVRFTELGSFKQRNYRVTITDPVKRVLVSAIPKAKQGLQYS